MVSSLRVLSLLSLTALLVLFLSSIPGPAEATVKIVPLGDSITKGSTQTADEAQYPTYRYWLWHSLQDNGYDVDFVGSWDQPRFQDFSFDQDNEGHGGYTTDGILNGASDDPWQGHLSGWLGSYSPDIALVELGTNDVLHQVPADQSIRNLEAIIDTLRDRNPHVKILVGTVIPTSIYRENLIALNQRIPEVAADKSTTASPVKIVDLYSGYDGLADNQLPLGVHPNLQGEKKIAAKWYNALVPLLDSSTPTPTPTSTPTSTPKPTPTQDSHLITGPVKITVPGTYTLANDITGSSSQVGIEIASSNVVLEGNEHTISGTGQDGSCGVFVSSSDTPISGVVIRNLKVSNWGYGIYYYQGVTGGTVTGCEVTGNSFAGVVLYSGGDRTTIRGNTITRNIRGVYLANVDGAGVVDNMLKNQNNAVFAGTVTSTVWALPVQAGTNIAGGPSLGGNYWGSTAGTGFSDTASDADHDGFSDQQYTVWGGNVDPLPLVTYVPPTPTPSPTPTPTFTPGPFTSLTVPGTLQAEQYDNGGEGTAYHDTTPGNQGGEYRQDDVDIESGASGYDLCFIRTGEWVNYTMQVATAGDYTAAFRAASWGDDHTITLSIDGTVAGTVVLADTGSSEVYADTAIPVSLPSGTHTLTLEFTGDGENLDYVVFTAVPVSTPTLTPTPTGNQTGTLQPIPPSTLVPTDPNNDGQYEDLNGDGLVDFSDVVIFFNQMDWIAENEPVAAFDFNQNGQIDFNDVVILFERL
ncbi:GDSL-type esterase/lipase family protein [Methanosphaerula palustris]|uniref:Probable pectate lyase C n=1 Tax=Methanosphaerula palustris (strain ATCC BAA-1556 / DSM 19958 / E1-9c) TaxID=521011 RepID=B8GJX5_METPE|nr:GDSL-type esterase/lipase family protein [Methanosphaerula palustris]ACL15779.1 Carbohydrate binding family 6 [Methanosphaerula palustris E1-9c]